MKKRFGIDIDGTVTCPSSLVPFLNEAFNLNITLTDIKQYDLNHLVDISEQEFAKWFEFNEPTIYQASPLATGALETLSTWSYSYELYFISARGNHLLKDTAKWFKENQIPFDHLELIGSHDKIAAAKKYQIDLFFEDKHDNAVMISQHCNIPVLLFDTPYNQDPIPANVIRVKNWYEAANWVEKWL